MKTTTRLHINIDHVATLRQQRGTSYPDPIWAASICELAGAHGITAHLREDRRHIQDRDLRLLRQTVGSVLNMEMAATDEMIGIALEVRPEICTLVPEKRAERTTEGGLDPATPGLGRAIERLKAGGIDVSLFIDPDPAAVRASAALGPSTIELHTGDYCAARGAKVAAELERVREAARLGASLGLKVAAGHGLDYPNVGAISALPEVEELNIGHAIICRAVLVGLDRAVREMLAAMTSPFIAERPGDASRAKLSGAAQVGRSGGAAATND